MGPGRGSSGALRRSAIAPLLASRGDVVPDAVAAGPVALGWRCRGAGHASRSARRRRRHADARSPVRSSSPSAARRSRGPGSATSRSQPPPLSTGPGSQSGPASSAGASPTSPASGRGGRRTGPVGGRVALGRGFGVNDDSSRSRVVGGRCSTEACACAPGDRARAGLAAPASELERAWGWADPGLARCGAAR